MIIQHWKGWAGVTGPGGELQPQKRCVPDENATGKCMCGGGCPILSSCSPSSFDVSFWPKDVKVSRSLENALWKICLFFSKEAEQRKEEKIVKKKNPNRYCPPMFHQHSSVNFNLSYKALCSHLIRGNFLSLKRRHFHPLCNKKFKVSIIMIFYPGNEKNTFRVLMKSNYEK